MTGKHATARPGGVLILLLALVLAFPSEGLATLPDPFHEGVTRVGLLCRVAPDVGWSRDDLCRRAAEIGARLVDGRLPVQLLAPNDAGLGDPAVLVVAVQAVPHRVAETTVVALAVTLSRGAGAVAGPWFGPAPEVVAVGDGDGLAQALERLLRAADIDRLPGDPGTSRGRAR